MRHKAPLVASVAERAWMARDDMRTLAQAEEIRANRRRLAAAVRAAAEETSKLSRITKRGKR